MRKFALFFIFLFVSGWVYSQTGGRYSHYDRLKVGGGVAMNFGNHGYFGLNISPFVGYQFTSILEGGVSTGYQYTKIRDTKQNLFSVGPYLNLYPIQNLFARLHYEHYTGTIKYKHSMQSGSFNEDALWIGGGYRTGDRIQLYIGFMYNLLYKEHKSLFAEAYQPIVGVSIGL